MKRLRIGEREIGEGRPCFIVAELGVNHDGDPAKAARMIETAALCGVDAVKLQRRDIDSILTRQAQEAPYLNERSFGATYGAHRRALELPDEAWPRLQSLAERNAFVFKKTHCRDAIPLTRGGLNRRHERRFICVWFAALGI